MRLKDKERLASYIDSLRPIIYIQSADHMGVDEAIGSLRGNATVFEYNDGGGMVDFDNKLPQPNPVTGEPYTLETFLEFFNDNEGRSVYLVLKDIDNYFDPASKYYSTKVIELIKSIALRAMTQDGVNITIFLVCPSAVLPPAIKPFVTIFDIPRLGDSEIKGVIESFLNVQGVVIDKGVIAELVPLFKGLGELEIEEILALVYQSSGTISREDEALIIEEKRHLVKRDSMLEVIDSPSSISEVGGLDMLKDYLKGKATIMGDIARARKNGIDMPRGILIVGMPGCGKSLTAKATARLFNVPLMRLDIGKLMGKYVGESEGNLREALKTCEAAAPIVLWIDEIEKAFAGVGGSSGASDITTRLFGQFLTWMSEKEELVYVVATSNKINALPPEFLRKGRFDELFLVDLPNEEERRRIFELHLDRRGKLTGAVNVIKLLKDTEGYSGADIEAVVKEAVETAFIKGKELTTDDLLEVIKHTKSISESLKDDIEALKKEYAKYNLKRASAG